MIRVPHCVYSVMFATGLVCLLGGLASCSMEGRAPSRPPLVEPAISAAAAIYERDTSAGIHDLSSLRGEPGPLRLHVDGDTYECSTCHDSFSGDLAEAALQGQHANITFDHGRNVLCLNCHNPKNSDVYLDHGGGEIPADNPTLLCAKCHGPHYREWQHDVHGRVNYYWDARFGTQKKLGCIQCHDPHRPKLPKMTPDPPPVLTRFDLQPKGAPSHE